MDNVIIDRLNNLYKENNIKAVAGKEVVPIYEECLRYLDDLENRYNRTVCCDIGILYDILDDCIKMKKNSYNEQANKLFNDIVERLPADKIDRYYILRYLADKIESELDRSFTDLVISGEK